MEEILLEFSDMLTKDIVDAINNHATPRPYDYWLLIITALSSILSFVAISCTIRISRKQNKIAMFEEKRKYYHRCLLPYLALELFYANINKRENEKYRLDEVFKYMEFDDYIYEIHQEYMYIKTGNEMYYKNKRLDLDESTINKFNNSRRYVEYKCNFLDKRISMLFKNISTSEIVNMYTDIIYGTCKTKENISNLLKNIKNELEKMEKQLKL